MSSFAKKMKNNQNFSNGYTNKDLTLTQNQELWGRQHQQGLFSGSGTFSNQGGGLPVVSSSYDGAVSQAGCSAGVGSLDSPQQIFYFLTVQLAL